MACLSETVDGQSMILCSALTATEPVAGRSVSRRKWPTVRSFLLACWEFTFGPLAIDFANS